MGKREAEEVPDDAGERVKFVFTASYISLSLPVSSNLKIFTSTPKHNATVIQGENNVFFSQGAKNDW